MNNSEIIFRILAAIICGGLIGYEREFKDKPAGFITHILVCVGAGVIAIVQTQIVADTIRMVSENPNLLGIVSTDSGRLIAQIVSGIGFLGAGTIIHFQGTVRGLTTAATLWVVAAIGIATGLGYYKIAFLSTLFVFIVLVVFKNVENRLQEKRNLLRIEIQFDCEYSSISNPIIQYFRENKIRIREISFVIEEVKEYKIANYIVVLPHSLKRGEVVEKLSTIVGIHKVSCHADL